MVAVTAGAPVAVTAGAPVAVTARAPVAVTARDPVAVTAGAPVAGAVTKETACRQPGTSLPKWAEAASQEGSAHRAAAVGTLLS